MYGLFKDLVEDMYREDQEIRIEEQVSKNHRMAALN
jgi:hypothetical protein